MNLSKIKLKKLQNTFPKLTEANQLFVLGFAEGLKQAQNCKPGDQPKEEKAGFCELKEYCDEN